jgi:hypothetical protein
MTALAVQHRKLIEPEGALLLHGICPNCYHTMLLPGPRAGISQDVLCPACHHEFCVCPVHTWCEWFGPATKDRLAWPYGITD